MTDFFFSFCLAYYILKSNFTASHLEINVFQALFYDYQHSPS